MRPGTLEGARLPADQAQLPPGEYKITADGRLIVDEYGVPVAVTPETSARRPRRQLDPLELLDMQVRDVCRLGSGDGYVGLNYMIQAESARTQWDALQERRRLMREQLGMLEPDDMPEVELRSAEDLLPF